MLVFISSLFQTNHMHTIKKSYRKIFLFIFSLSIHMSTEAQIAEVKVQGNTARIYDDNGRYTNHYVSIPSHGELLGYNAHFIVVREANTARIYDAKGRYTNKYISLCSSCTVKNVSATAILVKEGRTVRYYDFEGRYTNKYTTD